MKIGDEVFVHGYIDEIRKDCIIIRNEGGYFGTVPNEIKPKTKPQTDNDLILEWSCSFSECDNFENFGLNERCVWCKQIQRKTTEPQAERSK